MRFLNLGCGMRFHPNWDNVDFQQTGPTVRAHDLRKGIPYKEELFNAVYHSHVLEHFPRNEGKRFLRECYRVLRRGGVVRVAVPDLEGIVRVYLEKLEKVTHGEPGSADDYDWMLLEMYDQAIREEPCGGFAEYVRRDPIPNWDFVTKRWGTFAETAVQGIRKASTGRDSSRTRIAWSYVLRNPATFVYNRLVRLLLSKDDRNALQIGRFRRAGEVHMWMYDSYSLARLLRDVGFVQPQRVGATESKIPGWAKFYLDADPDGQVYKADSMYMEAFKP